MLGRWAQAIHCMKGIYFNVVLESNTIAKTRINSDQFSVSL